MPLAKAQWPWPSSMVRKFGNDSSSLESPRDAFAFAVETPFVQGCEQERHSCFALSWQSRGPSTPVSAPRTNFMELTLTLRVRPLMAEHEHEPAQRPEHEWRGSRFDGHTTVLLSCIGPASPRRISQRAQYIRLQTGFWPPPWVVHQRGLTVVIATALSQLLISMVHHR